MSRGSSVPGPLTRLVRDRLTLIGMLMLAVFASGAGYMREAASVQLQGSVDANWRGAFDILVRPGGQRLQLEQTAGLVEPNYVTFSGEGGISLEELASIRALPGIEVAAPIAMIGNVRYLVGGPVVRRGDLPEQPTLYEVTVRAATSNGLRDMLVQEQTTRVLLGPLDATVETTPFETEFGSLSWVPDGVDLFLDALPAIASPLIAVDPAAERALLGPSFGFLSPLESLASLPAQPTARDFDVSAIPAAFEEQRFYVSALATDAESPAAGRPVIPVAVSSTLYAPLTITLDVEQIGRSLAEYPTAGEVGRLDLAMAQAGEGRTRIGTTVLDATHALRPLQPPRLALLWPRSSEPEGSAASVAVTAGLIAELAARPDYTTIPSRAGGATLAYKVQPVGLVDASGKDQTPDAVQQGSVELGLDTAYRESRPAGSPLLDRFTATGPLDRPFVLAPVAEFDLDTLDLPDDPLNHVPLGAYAPPATRLVAGADGTPVDPQAMTPTLNPRGFISVPPLAITDLRSAVTLRGDSPIDAIRVRVGGIDRYDDQAVGRVERLASSIAAMGFDVDIVAGSSPQPIELLLQEYGADGSLHDVGWVEQGWTTLGAAERVVRGLGSVNWALLWLSGATALVFAAGIQLVKGTVRASEIAVLAALGWSSRRILRWTLAESLWAGGMVLVIGLLVWVATGSSGWLGPAFSLLLALAFPVATALATWRSMRRTPSIVTRIRSSDVHLSAAHLVPTVRGPATYGLRAAAVRSSRSLVLAITLGIGAAAVASGAVVVSDTAAAVGPTNMAAAISQLLSPFQVGMLIAIAGGTATLGMMLLRMDMQRGARSSRSCARVAGIISGPGACWRSTGSRSQRRLLRSPRVWPF